MKQINLTETSDNDSLLSTSLNNKIKLKIYVSKLLLFHMHLDTPENKVVLDMKSNTSHHSATFDSQFHLPKGESIHQRIILKNGSCNVTHPQSRREKFNVLEFLKLVDYSWTFTFTLFSSTLLLSWFAFAVLYWLICYTHGDFEPNHLPTVQKLNKYRPCLYDIYNFGSCFLFSIETQHTLGYGVKATTDECPEAIFVNAVQCLVGFIMQGIMAVVIFYKMTLPRYRHKTLLFSKYAVICPRNQKLCLMFRIGDTRKNDIVCACIRAFFIRTGKTAEGEKLINHQKELKVQSDGCESSLFFNWPLTIYHTINKQSPLYYFSPSDLNKDTFEIAVILEGTIESTGQMTQHRTSYMAKEILWGRKFEPVLTMNRYRKEYEVNLSKFDNLLPVSTPLCSAAYSEEFASVQDTKSSLPPHLRLDFTPRQSIGEIDKNAIAKLTGKIHINICNSSENESDYNSADEKRI